MLKEKLEAKVESSKTKVSADARAIMASGTQLVANEVQWRDLPVVGSRFPEFQLADSTGRVRKSKELVESEHLILSFFRGSW